ncbi:(2Fe-2S)-binding protein [Bradyrhizobium guangdongense]|uniref:(2Fe-2S)-binding protein n=1 Tax=Bradyrhizobium guangdongense TaxID=1325090 RepID=UPI001319FEFE|nr:(2Fe-2S)-binding protein [Bradyrhizobium guangdongense]
MIICSCNVISDRAVRDIVTAAEARPSSAAQVYDCLGCIVQCGQCSRSVKQVLEECSSESRQCRGRDCPSSQRNDHRRPTRSRRTSLSGVARHPPP